MVRVVAATPLEPYDMARDVAGTGDEYSFVVGGAATGWVRWTYRFRPVTVGTEVSGSWCLLRLMPQLGSAREQRRSLRDNLERALDRLSKVTECACDTWFWNQTDAEEAPCATPC